MARRVLRLAYWLGVAIVATTSATLVIAYSVGAGPLAFGNDDVARYLADNDPVAGSAPRPASPGTARDGAGHEGGTSGAAGGVTGGTASSQVAPGVNDPGVTVGTAPGGDPAAPGAANQAPAGGSGPPPTTAPTASAPGLLFSTGGSVVAICTGTTATLQTWTPKPGFRADDVAAGPATQVSVKFKSDTDGSFLVVVTCAQGTPTLSEQVIPDHGGPGGGGGGRG